MDEENYLVVTPVEISRVEKLAIEDGCREEHFIEEAGKKIASVALQWIEERKLPKRVTLLVGKGNNGADAYSAGLHLLAHEIAVRAIVVYEASNAENKKFKERFLEAKGAIVPFALSTSIHFDPLILDGLLGTGFVGEIDSLMARLIKSANDSGSFIIAIDIPSGLNGATGIASHPSILADQTVTLGFPKIGFFLKDGWNYVGKLRVESFGLPEKWTRKIKSEALLLNQKTLKLPPISKTRHKYEAGYVVGLSGSSLFKGAPKLAGLAALRSGAGMVRVFHLGEIDLSPMELICEPWNEDSWNVELKRAGALFLGPGLGQQIPSIDLTKIKLPMVVDADLLQAGRQFPKTAVLTPHRGEMSRLLGLQQMPDEQSLLKMSEEFAKVKEVVVVLKGSPTFIFYKNYPPLIVPQGDPGMATAGSGDVLTGIIAALLAQKMEIYEAARLGVYLHGLAGEEAAREHTSYSMIASDLISHLCKGFQACISLNHAMKREIPSSIGTVG